METATARVMRLPDLLRRRREPVIEDNDEAAVQQRRLTLIRRIAVTTWVVVIVYRTATAGVAFNRELLLLYIATGLAAASIGRRKMLMVIRDWLPFAVVLLVYDVSRGAAKLVGTPTIEAADRRRPLAVVRHGADRVAVDVARQTARRAGIHRNRRTPARRRDWH